MGLTVGDEVDHDPQDDRKDADEADFHIRAHRESPYSQAGKGLD
jgi:hypothetical protein